MALAYFSKTLLYSLSAIRKRRLCGLNRQWMLRCSRGINAEAEQFWVAVSYRFRSSKELTVISPTGDAQSRFADSRGNPAIIVSAYGLCRALHLFRPGRTISEQVDDLHATAAPCLREADAASNSWVILCLIRSRRIQTDEYRLARSFTQRPAKAVTVDFAGREAGIL